MNFNEAVESIQGSLKTVGEQLKENRAEMQDMQQRMAKITNEGWASARCSSPAVGTSAAAALREDSSTAASCSSPAPTPSGK